MKIVLIHLLLTLLFTGKINAKTSPPNEKKIYFHLHQATRWAELHYGKRTLFAQQEIRKHLGEIKYSQIKLVKSVFYQEFLFLNGLALDLSQGSIQRLEKFRSEIHSKADRFAIEHPKNWEREFTLFL